MPRVRDPLLPTDASALAPPLDHLRSRIRLPDGRWLEDTDLEIEATCRAVVLDDDATPWAAASALPIEIRAIRDGARVASGEVHLGDDEIVLAEP